MNMHANVVFRAFGDGILLAESPVMRICEEPWRFDVTISVGSRTISLAAVDGGKGGGFHRRQLGRCRLRHQGRGVRRFSA